MRGWKWPFAIALVAGCASTPPPAITEGEEEFEMIAHSYQNHLVSQAGELNQPFGNKDPPAAINIHCLGLSEIQASENPGLRIRRRRFIEHGRKLLQTRLGIQPEALVGPGGDKEGRWILQQLPQTPRQNHAFLFVQRARVGSG